MICPHCYEEVSPLKAAWLYFRLRVLPDRVYRYLEGRAEASDMNQLVNIYLAVDNSALLTEREDRVCFMLSLGDDYESIALRMNVTRERVRQIAYKVLRKLKGPQ